jgi:hypothetical protein
MRHKCANGQRVGTIPFGFRMAQDGHSLEEDPAEQDILARIHELTGLNLYSSPRIPYRKLAYLG